MAPVELWEDADPKDSLIILTFFTTGAAAPIAARYLVEHLNMPLVGHVKAPGLEHVVEVTDGRASSPIRIHGGDMHCNLGEPCQRVYLVGAEAPLPPEAVSSAVDSVIEWGAQAKLILVLDAVPREKGDDTADVFAAATGPVGLSRLAASSVDHLARGMLVGATGKLLASCKDDTRPAAAFLVEAVKQHPDGRAAAALIRALDPLIPEIKVDAAPLEEEAAEMEQQVMDAMRQAQSAQPPARPSHTFI